MVYSDTPQGTSLGESEGSEEDVNQGGGIPHEVRRAGGRAGGRAGVRGRSHVACGGVQRHSTGNVTGGE